MAAYRGVYDSRHLQADCQEPGSTPEPHARQSSMGYLLYLKIDTLFVVCLFPVVNDALFVQKQGSGYCYC